jgi:hypothetical protein
VKLDLPRSDRTLEQYRLRGIGVTKGRTTPESFDRVAFSAAHVVADPLADIDPWSQSAIDWERTIAFRHHLWDLGLGVAEAMDTAQRGGGLGWEQAKELIRRSVTAAGGRRGAMLVCGAGTDHLHPQAGHTLDDVLRAYEEQIGYVEGLGGKVVMMASRALAAIARGSDDYVRVYDRILNQVERPVIIHWLGDMFDPALAGYWGRRDHREAMSVALDVIAAHHAKVDGVKISLLSKELEIEMRRKLPNSVKMYTGDDFNYPDLIAGDAYGFSDALLGIFDAIAPAASSALERLSRGDRAGFFAALDPTLPLSRHIFRAPTMFYKTGVVFLAYLNGHQDHFMMLGGQQSARSVLHLCELFRLADQANVLEDPELAVRRMRSFLALTGVA